MREKERKEAALFQPLMEIEPVENCNWHMIDFSLFAKVNLHVSAAQGKDKTRKLSKRNSDNATPC